MNDAPQKEWLSRKEAAAYLMSLGYLIAPRTLSRMAAKGLGPPYRRILHRIASYNRQQLKDWAHLNSLEMDQAALAAKALKLSKRTSAATHR